MQIEPASRIEDTVQLDQPRRHHHQIGGDIVAPERFDEALHEIDQRLIGELLAELDISLFAPLPCVGEGASALVLARRSAL